MATLMNPFDLLGDDIEDPSQFIAAQEKLEKPKKAAGQPQAAQAKQAKLPSKPLPPAQAVKEAKNEVGRGGGRGSGRGRGRGRGGGGFNREPIGYENGDSNGFSGGMKPSEEGESGKPFERRGYGGLRGSFRGGHRGGFNNGEYGDGERPRRFFERRSGTGRGNDFKRDGAGRGNWGKSDEFEQVTDDSAKENEKGDTPEKQLVDEDAAVASKENPVSEPEEKEPEDKEMTLEEYEKILEEKRKALLALKTEERKVDVDRELQSMQQLSKKDNDDVFIKLGSDKEKRKDAAEKEEKAKKSVPITEFLKPAEGERYYGLTGRGRGRGRGSRGGYGGGSRSNVPAPSISDSTHFPSLGSK